MKSYSKILRVVVLCVCAATSASIARAFEGKIDMTMTAGRDGAMPMTYLMKGSRMRMEFTPAPDKKGRSQGTFASIVNWDTREMIMLMPEQKMYMVHKISDETAEKAAKGSDVDFQPTGRKEKIAGIQAEEYAGMSDGKRTEIWVTKELGKFMMANQGKGGPMGGKKKGDSSAWQKFAEQGDFFALRVIQRKKEGAPEDFRMEVTKVDKGAQPDSLFKPPADFEKFEMPNMGGMGDMLKGMIPGGSR